MNMLVLCHGKELGREKDMESSIGSGSPPVQQEFRLGDWTNIYIYICCIPV